MGIVINTKNTGISPNDDQNVKCSAKTMVSGDVVFTVSGGDILLKVLASECETVNDATASLVTYQVIANGQTQTISAASTTLASKPVGTAFCLQPGALTNAPFISGNAAGVTVVPWGAIRVPSGATIGYAISGGSTTGTWSHYAVYTPIEEGATLVPAR